MITDKIITFISSFTSFHIDPALARSKFLNYIFSSAKGTLAHIGWARNKDPDVSAQTHILALQSRSMDMYEDSDVGPLLY